jgi:hypothetical protein
MLEKAKKHLRKYSVGYGLLAIFAILFSLAPLSPSYKKCAEEQEKSEPARKSDESGPEFLGRLATWKAFTVVNCEGDFFHNNEGIFTAISTIFIAMFTLTLWRSTERLWGSAEETSRRVNRAYLACGGPYDPASGIFYLDVENNGQTPAFMLDYDVKTAMPGQVGMQSALRVDRTHQHWEDTIPPRSRKQIETRVKVGTNVAFVFGCVWYRDVWGDPHRTRFILSVNNNRTWPNVAGVNVEYTEAT